MKHGAAQGISARHPVFRVWPARAFGLELFAHTELEKPANMKTPKPQALQVI
jgi:hypothetical protein